MISFFKQGFLLIAAITLLSASFSRAEQLRVKILKVGDTIAEFVLPDVITNEKVSFNNDIKGNSKALAIFFTKERSSSSKSLRMLVSDLADKSLGGFIACEIDITGQVDRDYADNGYTFPLNIKYTLKDIYFEMPEKFGFSGAPSLVIADGAGKILFLKPVYQPGDDNDIKKFVKDAFALSPE